MLIRSINFIIKSLDILAGITLGLIVVYITIHALLRYSMGGGLPSTYPIVQNLLVILVFFSLAKAQVEKQHIRIDFIKNKLKENGQKIIDSFVYIVAIIFVFFMFLAGIMSLQESLAINEYFVGSINISAFPARLALGIGSLLLLVQFIVEIIQRIIISKCSKK